MPLLSNTNNWQIPRRNRPNSLKAILLTILVGLLFSSAPFASVAQNCTTRVASIDANRGYTTWWTLNGYQMTSTREKLENPVNFGPSGTSACTFDISDISATITQTLLSNYDILFIGYWYDGTFSQAELQAMYDWVDLGGIMLITADSYAYDDVAEKFGHSTDLSGGYSNTPATGQASHPIFSGPFGTITSYNAVGSVGAFSNTTGATVLAESNGNAVLLEKNVGAGKVIITGDVCTISSAVYYGTISLGPNIDPNNSNDILTANMFHYLSQSVTPPPPPGTIVADVWDDQNNNAVKNSNEPDISGVDVELINANTNAVVTTEATDANGQATFNNVAPGDYKLRFIAPADHKLTSQTSRPIGDDNRSDAIETGVDAGLTGSFTVVSNQTVNYVDAGMWAPGFLETEVWDDQNSLTVQNSNEPGIAGVQVDLVEADNPSTVLATDITDANGLADFDGLKVVPADRPVRLLYTLLDDHKFTPKTTRPITDDTRSDANENDPNIGLTDPFSLSKGSETIRYVDAGMWAPGSIETEVWDDRNSLSVQNSNEPGIGSVVVELQETDGTVIATENTNSSGVATFTGVVPADRPVKLRYYLPSDHKFTPKTSRPITDDSRSDAEETGTDIGLTGEFSLAKGSETIRYVDAGMWAPGSIETHVWDDRNSLTVKNSNEPGIENVQVDLLESDGSLIASDFTDANGLATFDGLVPADRPVKLKYYLPEDHKFTPKTTRPIGDDNRSDAEESGTDIGLTGEFSVSAGSQTVKYVDGGMWAPGEINAQVFLDANGNGVKNSNEDGLYGFVVNLLEDDDSPVVYPPGHPKAGQAVTAITQCGGGIANLYLPADRSVKLQFIDNGASFVATTNRPITDDNRSDAIQSGADIGKTATFEADRGSDVVNFVDAGVSNVGSSYTDATVNTFVWDDRNADKNHQGEGNFGIQGVKVSLTDSDGNVCACATTGADGKASIPAISDFASRFRLKFDLKADHKFTGRTTPITNDKNNDAKGDGTTDLFSINAGQTVSFVEAGMFVPGDINTFVFDDRNADKNHQGEGNFGVEEVTVQLIESDGSDVIYPSWHPNKGQVVAAEVTDQDGKATIPYLPANRSFRLKFTLKDDHKFTGRTTPVTNDKNNDAKGDGTTDLFSMKKGSETIEYVEAGMFVPGDINTFVFDDRNADKNHQGEGNFGVEEVTVQLIESDGSDVLYPDWHPNDGDPVAAVETGADGKVNIPYMPADRSVRLKFTLKDDHKFTGRTTPVTNDKNNDAKGDGTTDLFSMKKGSETIEYVEAGMFVPGEINTFVFDDRNADKNHQGEGNFGVEEVTVQLIESGGGDVLYPDWHPNAGNPVAAVETGTDGKVNIPYMPADRSVRLKFTLKEDHKFTGRTTPVTNDKNNDAKGDGTTDLFSMKKGSEIIEYVEAGMLVPGRLNSFVFEDRNGDKNHQGEGSFGIPGVKIQLIESNGDRVQYPSSWSFYGKSGDVDEITTAADGKGSFDFVPSDRSLRLKFILPNGYSFTGRTTPITNDKNSDAKGDGTTDLFSIKKGSELIEYVEAGVIPASARVAGPSGDRNDENSLSSLVLYPVPADARLMLSVEAAAEGDAIYEVLDLAGKVVDRKDVRLVEGNNKLKVNTGNLANGSYLLRLYTSTGRLQQAFIISR